MRGLRICFRATAFAFCRREIMGKSERVDINDILNAVLYVLENGCKWRCLPKEYHPQNFSGLRFLRKFRLDGDDALLSKQKSPPDIAPIGFLSVWI